MTTGLPRSCPPYCLISLPWENLSKNEFGHLPFYFTHKRLLLHYCVLFIKLYKSEIFNCVFTAPFPQSFCGASLTSAGAASLASALEKCLHITDVKCVLCLCWAKVVRLPFLKSDAVFFLLSKCERQQSEGRRDQSHRWRLWQTTRPDVCKVRSLCKSCRTRCALWFTLSKFKASWCKFHEQLQIISQDLDLRLILSLALMWSLIFVGFFSVRLSRNNSSLKTLNFLIGKMSSCSNVQDIHAEYAHTRTQMTMVTKHVFVVVVDRLMSSHCLECPIRLQVQYQLDLHFSDHCCSEGSEAKSDF